MIVRKYQIVLNMKNMMRIYGQGNININMNININIMLELLMILFNLLNTNFID